MFSGPAVYIPVSEVDNKLTAYGNFCSPECAAAYLFNENIDNATKWSRYSLLNKVYSHIYDYKTNIKIAPEPRYILNKYSGLLRIEEYRNINTNFNRHILIVNKPITMVTPEVFDTNFIINQSSINKY